MIHRSVFFKKERHNNLYIYYLSQACFQLPKRTIPNNSNEINLINQILKDIETVYRDVGGHDMSYVEFEESCRKSLEDEYNYLYIVRSKKRGQGIYCFCNEKENTYIECTPETKLF